MGLRVESDKFMGMRRNVRPHRPVVSILGFVKVDGEIVEKLDLGTPAGKNMALAIDAHVSEHENGGQIQILEDTNAFLSISIRREHNEK